MRTFTKLAATAAIVCAASVAACSTTPAVAREHTMMTPAQIAEMGLICRTERPATSNIPLTMCASEAAWAVYDRQTRLASEELFAEGRKLPNSGRFNRQ